VALGVSGAYGPVSLQDIEDNFESLTDLGRANGVQVVLSSILPVHNYTPASQDMYRVRPPEKISALNNWLQNYCRDGRCVYLDYFSTMVDKDGLMRKDFAEDGVHPTDAAYAVMAPLAEKAIRTALDRRTGTQ
jgi:lysophospholipase L1-like esterase